MIKGLHDTRRIAESILDLANGDCELCGLQIGNKYVAIGQIFPRETEEGHTVEIHYEVACKECYRHINALLEARRSLKNKEQAETC